jgi:hypothetical protein
MRWKDTSFVYRMCTLASMRIVCPFSENKCKCGKPTHRRWFAAAPTTASEMHQISRFPFSHYVALKLSYSSQSYVARSAGPFRMYVN